MYSNKILNFQESTTISNACTKKSGNLLNAHGDFAVTIDHEQKIKESKKIDKHLDFAKIVTEIVSIFGQFVGLTFHSK